MVKNTFVLLSALLLINTSVMAKSPVNKSFYIKALVGTSKITGVKNIDQDINFQIKQNSNNSISSGVGIGYHITPSIRTDLILENSKFNFTPKRGDFNFIDDTGLQITGNQLIRKNSTAQTLMLNTYIDILDISPFKIFIGGGIGQSTIKEKVTGEFKRDDIIVNGAQVGFPVVSFTETNKAKNKFAYALTIGSDIKFTDILHVELAYSWKHYGKTKDCNNKYQGHNVSTSIRFDL